MKKIKSIGQLYEEYMDGANEHIRQKVRELGGDGVVCPDCTYDGCGCSLEDFPACDESLDELFGCYPAKGQPGEFEGEKCTVYFKIEEEK